MCLAAIYWGNWDRWRELFKLLVAVEEVAMEKEDEEEEEEETTTMRMEIGDIRGGDDGTWNDSMTI